MGAIQEKAMALAETGSHLKAMSATLGLKGWTTSAAALPHVLGPLRTATATSDVRSRIATMLIAGEVPPADVAEPILEARRADELARARADVIVSVLDEAHLDVAAASDETIAPALRYLRDELGRVIDRAKDLAPQLAGNTTPDAVLQAPAAVAEAWRELRDLADEYNEIRTAHEALFRRVWKAEQESSIPLPKADFDTVGHFADFHSATARWVKLRREAAGGSEPGAYGNWLREHLSPTLTGLDHLAAPAAMAMIATRSRPWVPDVATFIAARTAAQGALAPADWESTARRVDYRNTLLRVTGDPAAPITAPPAEGLKRRISARGEEHGHQLVKGRLRLGGTVADIDREQARAIKENPHRD